MAHVISHVSKDGKNGWYFENHSSDDQSIRFVVSDTSGSMTISNNIPISNNSFTHILLRLMVHKCKFIEMAIYSKL